LGLRLAPSLLLNAFCAAAGTRTKPNGLRAENRCAARDLLTRQYGAGKQTRLREILVRKKQVARVRGDLDARRLPKTLGTAQLPAELVFAFRAEPQGGGIARERRGRRCS
jgi:hypothetical protein